jgi:subtilisin-like proprotein convertase family protein
LQYNTDGGWGPSNTHLAKHLAFKGLKMITRLLSSSLGAAAALMILAAPAYADVQGGTSNTTPTTITDANATGVTSTITIMENELIEDVSFCIEGLNHTWMGDLVATITHVDTGTSATLFSRPGKGASAGNGDSSNFIFADATNNDLWDEMARGSTDYDIRNTAGSTTDPQATPFGTYFASAANGARLSLDSIFAGESTQGTWEFNISDRNATQVGTYDNVSIKFGSSVVVPEPGTVGFCVIACSMLGFSTYRRRKKKADADKA